MSRQCASILILAALLSAVPSSAQDKWDSDPLDVLEMSPEMDDDELPKQGNFEEIDPSGNAKIFTEPDGKVESSSTAAETILPAEELPSEDIEALALETADTPAPAEDIPVAEEVTPIEDTPPPPVVEIPDIEEEVPAPVVETPPPPPPEPPAPVVEAPAQKAASKKSFAPIERLPDGPDLNKEERFHRIYSTYNVDPTPLESWDAVVANRPSKSYLIQKKDTLSGISEMLFGDPHYWPKLWAQNSESILNPHIIQPGLNVNFYPGSVDEVPTLDVGVALADGSEIIEAEAEQKFIDESGMETVQKEKIKIRIPPPKRKTPVLSKLPPSLPRILTRIDEQKEPGIEIQTKPHRIPSGVEYLGYFVADNKIEGVGQVRSIELDLPSAGENQYIYVVLDGANSGSYVVQKNLDKVKGLGILAKNANMVEVQGEIQIVEVVNASKNIYRAIVTKSISPITTGSLLVPGRMQMVDVSSQGSVASIPGAIIGGQFSDVRKVLGAHNYVFINVGSDKGVTEGMALPVYADEDRRTRSASAYENGRQIGQIKVVKVSESFATGYVQWANDEINVGDFVGTRDGTSSGAVSSVTPPESFEEDFDMDIEDTPADDLSGEDEFSDF